MKKQLFFNIILLLIGFSTKAQSLGSSDIFFQCTEIDENDPSTYIITVPEWFEELANEMQWYRMNNATGEIEPLDLPPGTLSIDVREHGYSNMYEYIFFITGIEGNIIEIPGEPFYFSPKKVKFVSPYQVLCGTDIGTLTLADVELDPETIEEMGHRGAIIEWFDEQNNLLPANTILENKTYYAHLQVGNTHCFSAELTPLIVIYNDSLEADAGPDQTKEGEGSNPVSFTMAATGSAEGVQRQWSIVSVVGGNTTDVSIQDMQDPTTIVTFFDNVTEVTLKWTVSPQTTQTSCVEVEDTVILRRTQSTILPKTKGSMVNPHLRLRAGVL